ncbi:DUF456 domain-containing protein [Treponema pectinovorum]|uniref:DUF456 domain-containing protein n=1 Tax=Treponema pectinovorum TaxID=164 RepID=UPI0011CC9F8C|nr:DUF456 domain-containing protein [Treponema pectinovorum]
MNVDILLAIFAALTILLGLVGCVYPLLPGVPLAWLGLLISHFCRYTKTSIPVLIITLLLTIVVTVLDFILQPYLTKRSGGSKKAVMGATIGLFASLFFGPLFIILGPFLGAFIGELLTNPGDADRALKAAAGSFVGFLLGSGIKMICVIAFIWIFCFNFFI